MSQSSPFSTEAKAGALALLVHGAFLFLLVFGVSWQTEHPAPVQVDLWQALPQPAPVPTVKPRPAPPEPRVTETPPAENPDIALEKKKRDEKRAEKMKQAELEEKNALEKAARDEAEKLRAKREAQRRTEELDMQRRMMEEDLASEARQVKQLAARASASRRASEKANIVAQFQDQIRAKVRSNTRLPENLRGNPQVKFQVRLLPTGEVLNVQLVQGSGTPAYDEAVERAIYKSSPLPLPDDKDARSAFVPAVILSHRPRD